MGLGLLAVTGPCWWHARADSYDAPVPDREVHLIVMTIHGKPSKGGALTRTAMGRAVEKLEECSARPTSARHHQTHRNPNIRTPRISSVNPKPYVSLDLKP